LASKRFSANPERALAALLGVLALLTVFYRLALDNLTDSLLDQSVFTRIVVSVLVLIPLGLCLGMFMPLGLGVVSGMGNDGESYTAWAWAVNGFFSVIGSVLTTILAMEFGFSKVQVLAWIVYAIAVVAFVRLHHRAEALAGG
jgi:glucan phosphoethanolaminetransferase (alkaline phosphatase superfamily)